MAAYDTNTGNPLMTCPIDSVHRVKKSGMQIHITKCFRNNPDVMKASCMFNHLHIISRSEYEHHLLVCPDNDTVIRQMTASVEKNNPYVKKHGTVYVDPCPPIQSTDSWDTEISSVPSSGYHPLTRPPNGGIIQPPEMSQPAERRELYRRLHDRSNDEPNAERKDVRHTPLRQPINPPKVIQLAKAQEEKYEHLGLGRGSLANGSRIAANIFGPNANEPRQPNTYSGIASKGILRPMAQLGLGRSQGNSANMDPAYNDEFPSLGGAGHGNRGIGRGNR